MTPDTDTSPTADPAAARGLPTRRSRLTRLRLGVLLAVASVALPGAASAQRPPNESLLVDLSQAPPPAMLSASGLYTDMASQTPAPGILPYSVNSPLWSDGAYKTRFLALPGEAQIEFSREGRWIFPVNTVLVKNFYLDLVRGDPASRRIVETRFLVHGGPVMGWRGFSYMWNDAGTEAELLPTGATKRFAIEHPEADSVQHLDYAFPAPEDCVACHTWATGQVLGPRTGQLNGPREGDPTGENQLDVLNRLGVFTADIGDVADLPRWANPADEAAPVADRARAYLAANCSHCHLPGGLRRTEIDLRYATPLDEMRLVDRVSGVDDLDLETRRLIKPGDPANSVLWLRTQALDDRRMPPLATSVVDAAGSGLLQRWIVELGRPTAVHEVASTPRVAALSPAWPNPFNATTTIEYTVAAPAWVTLAVFDALGRAVRSLVARPQGPGRYRVAWDGHDDDGRGVASGVYLYRLVAGSHVETRRLALLK